MSAPVPDRVKVGPHTYRVKVTRKAMNRAEARQGVQLRGLCEFEVLRITLEPSTPTSKQREILLHETLHAVHADTNVWGQFPDDDDEHYVRTVAPALLALLRDNPRLVAYLTAE